MKKTVKIDLQDKSALDLQKHLNDKRKELLETKVKHHMGQIKDTSVFNKIRSEVTYCLELLTKAK